MTGCVLAVLGGGLGLWFGGENGGTIGLFAAAFCGGIGWGVDYLRDPDTDD